ncbi:MAG: hypothetical protein BLITH_0372 [Brockia lithotrophica]|uniref:Uncharacterized protein n=1 Tax=Brockia lithotrophica TaxID=933949 RepID=A0A2T5GAT4_9BACL|nr:MAG: hypothetical protein BLITH_0372 [Brockia lithotrophica]
MQRIANRPHGKPSSLPPGSAGRRRPVGNPPTPHVRGRGLPG